MVDVSAASAVNADYQVAVADFTGWEATHGAIEPDTIVLIRTDFAKRWPDARSYLGTDEKGASGGPLRAIATGPEDVSATR